MNLIIIIIAHAIILPLIIQLVEIIQEVRIFLSTFGIKLEDPMTKEEIIKSMTWKIGKDIMIDLKEIENKRNMINVIEMKVVIVMTVKIVMKAIVKREIIEKTNNINVEKVDILSINMVKTDLINIKDLIQEVEDIIKKIEKVEGFFALFLLCLL